MSKTSSSIGLFPLIMALVVGYNLFIDDDDESTDIKTEVKQVVEQVQESRPELSEKFQQLTDKLQDQGKKLEVMIKGKDPELETDITEPSDPEKETQALEADVADKLTEDEKDLIEEEQEPEEGRPL